MALWGCPPHFHSAQKTVSPQLRREGGARAAPTLTTLGPHERPAFLVSKCLLRQALFRPFRGSVCFHKELFKPKHRCSFENEKSN